MIYDCLCVCLRALCLNVFVMLICCVCLLLFVACLILVVCCVRTVLILLFTGDCFYVSFMYDV